MTIQERITAIRDEIKAMEYKLDIKREVLSELQMVAKDVQPPIPIAEVRAPGRRNAGKSNPDLIDEILQEAGDSLTTKEIVARLESRGVTSASRHGLRSVVATVLSRDDRFVRIEPGVFDLASRQKAGEIEK